MEKTSHLIALMNDVLLPTRRLRVHGWERVIFTDAASWALILSTDSLRTTALKPAVNKSLPSVPSVPSVPSAK